MKQKKLIRVKGWYLNLVKSYAKFKCCRTFQASRLATNKSLLHKVDKRLRKVVGERIAAALESSDNDDHDDAATTSVGMDMVKVRTDLLKDLKSGGSSDFSLPEDLAQRLQEGPASDSDLAELDTVLNKMFDMKIGK